MESTATFQALLQDKQNTKSFLYFLQLEFGEENLAFYLDVEDFKQTLDVDKAKKIIDEYIKPYSEKEVNISYKTKCAVATRIESMLHIHLGFRDPSIENGRESISTRDRRPSTVTGPPMGILAATEAGGLADLFREAQDEVFQLLFLGPFQRYKSREDINAANSHILYVTPHAHTLINSSNFFYSNPEQISYVTQPLLSFLTLSVSFTIG